MMTPILGADENSPQEYYTQRQTSVRSLIERVNGTLKMRFRCLLKHRVLHYDPVKAAKIANACCVLHNMCIANNVPAPEPDPVEDVALMDLGMYQDQDDVNHVDLPGNRVLPELVAGRRMQEQITRLLWHRREREGNNE